jgi:hypothetical protein
MFNRLQGTYRPAEEQAPTTAQPSSPVKPMKNTEDLVNNMQTSNEKALRR